MYGIHNTGLAQPQASVIVNCTHDLEEYERRAKVDATADQGDYLYPTAVLTKESWVINEGDPVFARKKSVRVKGLSNVYIPHIAKRQNKDDNDPFVFATLNGLRVNDNTFPYLTEEEFKALPDHKKQAYIRSFFLFIGLSRAGATKDQFETKRTDLAVQAGGIFPGINHGKEILPLGCFVVWNVPVPKQEREYAPMGNFKYRQECLAPQIHTRRNFIYEVYDPSKLVSTELIQETINEDKEGIWPDGASPLQVAQNIDAHSKKDFKNGIYTTDNAVWEMVKFGLICMEAGAGAGGPVDAAQRLKVLFTSHTGRRVLNDVMVAITRANQEVSNRIIGKSMETTDPGEMATFFLGNSHTHF